MRMPASAAYSLPAATAPLVPRAACIAGCSISFCCAMQAISALKKRRPSFDFIGLPNYNQTLLLARLAHNRSVDMDSEDRECGEPGPRSRDDEPMLFCPRCN